jgi:hypothetical protein
MKIIYVLKDAGLCGGHKIAFEHLERPLPSGQRKMPLGNQQSLIFFVLLHIIMTIMTSMFDFSFESET